MHFRFYTSSVKLLVLSAALAGGLTLTGCKDDYVLDDEEPSAELLGASIYDYLREDG